jgi:Fe-Mn family superoxide dismutase
MADVNVSRRSILTAAAALPLTRLAGAAPTPAPIVDGEVIQTGGPFTLPPLPYAYDALEKAIDAQTMTLHHDKHHATYVKNLNDALSKVPAWQSRTLEDILAHLGDLPAEVRTVIRNNGGGHDNHSIFWSIMSPTGGGEPTGAIKTIIDRDFGGFDKFKAAFEDAGVKRFGSGWAWLVLTKEKKYEIVSLPNQDSPRIDGNVPIMGNDVWEHAYYLRYQNRRADYLKAWWNVVNWAAINDRIAKAA